VGCCDFTAFAVLGRLLVTECAGDCVCGLDAATLSCA
jgi:hypothetical protein